MKNDFWRGKRVLLTGHTGFKGSWLALVLGKLGAEVHGAALAPEGRPNLFDLLAPWDGPAGEIVDIRDRARLGAVVRRWLPHHLFVYIFARGFFGTLLATAAAGWLALAHTGASAGLSTDDLLIGRGLAAWGEAIVSGMLVSIFVAYRPQWLATYSDALYLPRS